MPVTFMRYFYIASNIRRLMNTMDWPDAPEYTEMLDAFKSAFGDSILGTRVVDSLPSRSPTADAESAGKYEIDHEEPLAASVYDALLQALNTLGERFVSAYSLRSSTRTRPTLNPNGQEVPSVTRQKITYATSEKGIRNSFVLFRTREPSGESHVRAGQISKIYMHARGTAGKKVVEPFLLIKAYQPLDESDVPKDPYRRWPDINTELYYNEFEEEARMVRLQDVITHFAAHVYTPEDISRECIVVRNLDRVSLSRYCRVRSASSASLLADVIP